MAVEVKRGKLGSLERPFMVGPPMVFSHDKELDWTFCSDAGAIDSFQLAIRPAQGNSVEVYGSLRTEIDVANLR